MARRSNRHKKNRLRAGMKPGSGSHGKEIR
nr:MAG TPA: hypothetical protein [Caudoviricetes sp.]